MRATKKAAALLEPGDVAVVIGAGGGLGHIGVQLLAALTPADVVAVDVSEETLALATELGAHHAFPSAHALEATMELTKGRGADVVIDFVGEHGTPSLALSLLGQGGTYLVVGYGDNLEVPTAEVVVKEIRVEGTLVGTYDELAELVGMVERGDVLLHATRYPLERVNEALDDLRGGRVRGRAVIVPSNGEVQR
jgi:NAD+-dependent secondary alcohol dehydrogenase Adh1